MIRIPHRAVNPKVVELKLLPIFRGLSPRELRSLASNLDEVTIPKGERFITEGRSNDTFFILLDGQVELTVGARAHEVVKRGDIVGLPSMFARLESTADAVAKTEVRALVASHKQFNSLVANAEIEIRFKAAMFDRLRDEVYQLTHSPTKAVGKVVTMSSATGEDEPPRIRARTARKPK
jgi:CRP-like cAMP-binding protein